MSNLICILCNIHFTIPHLIHIVLNSIRQLGLVQPTRLAPLVKPLLDRLGQKKLPAFLPKTIQFPITAGAHFIFWTWLCIAFSDVGGYFAGRKFGRTKLDAISPAAGKTSPNKTVEGVIGGCAFSMALADLLS